MGEETEKNDFLNNIYISKIYGVPFAISKITFIKTKSNIVRNNLIFLTNNSQVYYFKISLILVV